MVKKNNGADMRIKTLSIALLIASRLFAGENGFYGGLDIEYLKLNATVTSGANTYKGHESGPAYTFKAGYYFNDNSRLYAFYQYVDTDVSSASLKQYGAGYDYMIGENAFKPFIGILAGQINSKVDNTLDKFDISGNFVGAQAGISYALNTNWSVEGGYRYLDYSNVDGLESVDNVNVESDSAQSWFAGLNFKF